MTTLLWILGFALLFALFGFARPRAECDHNCGGCTKACGVSQEGEAWKA